MFNNRIKTINLGKLPDMSLDGYWVADINDGKLQEIANALGFKLNIVTSGSEWYLYTDDEHKTTGVYATFKSNIFQMFLYKDGLPSNNGDKYAYNYSSIPIQLIKKTSSADYAKIETAKIWYIKGDDETVIFGLSGYYNNSYRSEYKYGMIHTKAENMYDKSVSDCIIALTGYGEMSPISKNSDTFIVLLDGKGATKGAFRDISSIFASEVVTMLTPYPIYINNIFYTLKNIYFPFVAEQRTHYFSMDNKDYYYASYDLNGMGNHMGDFVMSIPSEE